MGLSGLKPMISGLRGVMRTPKPTQDPTIASEDLIPGHVYGRKEAVIDWCLYGDGPDMPFEQQKHRFKLSWDVDFLVLQVLSIPDRKYVAINILTATDEPQLGWLYLGATVIYFIPRTKS